MHVCAENMHVYVWMPEREGYVSMFSDPGLVGVWGKEYVCVGETQKKTWC